MRIRPYQHFSKVVELIHVIWKEHITAYGLQLSLMAHTIRSVAQQNIHQFGRFFSSNSLVEILKVEKVGVVYIINRVHGLP